MKPRIKAAEFKNKAAFIQIICMNGTFSAPIGLVATINR
jgi:hypothetical protein